MIIAIILLGIALLGVSAYAASLREKLSAARAASLRPADQEQRFREIAAALLADSSQRLNDSTASRINDLLTPLQRNIEAFNRTIDEKYSREATERGALREKIDELRRLNESLGLEARHLADALRGNSKVQGDWGEMILETLLQQAGFTQGQEYTLQQTVSNAQGRNLRPDVVLNFPDGGCVVIDSKASLTAYVNLCAATSDSERQAAVKAHLLSVRKHVDELAAKKYHDLVPADRKLDFTMMFIPNEGAYVAAMQADGDIWQYAYDRHVLIVSPTHLFSVLKLISQMWQHDAQTRNALQIAQEAGKLYDKFAGFYADLQGVGDALDKARNAHLSALRKLQDGPGSLTSKVEKLKALGAKASKSLPRALILLLPLFAAGQVRPVSSAWMAEVGSAHLANTYLSSEKYAGQHYGLTHSRLQAMKLRGCVQGWDLGLSFSTARNRAGNSRMLGAEILGSWRIMRRWYLPKGFQLGIGGMAEADFGALYLQRNSNNPAQALGALSVGPEGFVQWAGKIKRLPLAVRWQGSSPLLGAFFCPAYGELYYEIQLGNRSDLVHFAWPGSRRAVHSLLSVDLNFGRSTLRLGYHLNALSSKANNIIDRQISHCAVIGVVCDLVTINPRKNDEKLLPALY